MVSQEIKHSSTKIGKLASQPHSYLMTIKV